MAICDTPISVRSPWQNCYAERLICSIHREYLYRLAVFGGQHLRRLLCSYAEYYKSESSFLHTPRMNRDEEPFRLNLISKPTSPSCFGGKTVTQGRRHLGLASSWFSNGGRSYATFLVRAAHLRSRVAHYFGRSLRYLCPNLALRRIRITEPPRVWKPPPQARTL